MAAVTFSTDTDDSGAGTDGTIHNNAWKQAMATAINAAFTDWTTYTPTWGNTGTANTLGNGTIAGQYTVINDTVHFQIQLVWGSTTNDGSGVWTFTLPVTAVAVTAPGQALGSAVLTDASVGAYGGIVQQFSTTTCIIYNTDVVSTGVGAGTVPFTWVTTDTCSLHGTYRAA